MLGAPSSWQGPNAQWTLAREPLKKNIWLWGHIFKGGLLVDSEGLSRGENSSFFHLEVPPSQVELVGLKGFQIFSKSSKIIVFHLCVPREAVTLEALVIQRGRVERDVERFVEEFKGCHIVTDMDHLNSGITDECWK